MDEKLIQNIIKSRICVGYLGESAQYSWWQGSFYAPTSTQFLSPVFGKTSHMAQYHGVKEAAALIHDERIGIGASVYHLFRLPEMLEQDMHRLLLDGSQLSDIQEITASQETAEQFLLEFAKNGNDSQIEGPVSVGGVSSIESNANWKKVAGLYIHAMQNNVKVFPYFS